MDRVEKSSECKSYIGCNRGVYMLRKGVVGRGMPRFLPSATEKIMVLVTEKKIFE